MAETVDRCTPLRFGRCFPYVLMYHSVAVYSRDPHLVTVGPARFEAQLRWLRARGLRGVSMGELLAAARSGGTRGLVGLTFDDGYADFTLNALPALRRNGCTATVFAIAGRLGQHNAWDADGPRKELMNVDELRRAADAGMEIGSHGLHHRRVSRLEPIDLRAEVEHSRTLLRELTGVEIGGFCYPYGDLSAAAVDLVRSCGYDYGCAIWRDPLSGRHALPRTYVGDRDAGLRLLAKRLRHESRVLRIR